MPSRRALLAALGAAGTVGGVGFWQRRRIRRREDLETLERVGDIEVHSEPDPVWPVVTPDHVATSYDRARTHLDRTEEYLDDDTPAHVERHVDGAHERLDGAPPDEQTNDADRESALQTYRLAVASSATARGAALDEDRNAPSEEFREAYDALTAALEDFDPDYPGERLARVVVQGGEADDLISRAASAERIVSEHHVEDPGPMTWERVEITRARVHDAEQLVETLDGPARADDLRSAFDAFAERTEADVDPVDFSYDGEGDLRNHASDRWMRAITDRDPRDSADNGRYARAVRDQAERATTAATLEALTEYPSRRHLREKDADPPADTSDVLAAKRDAVDALADAVEAVDDDPLGNLLLGTIRSTIEGEDRWLGRAVENVRSYDDEEWDDRIYHAFLTYRGAALQAAAVPGVVEAVQLEDRGG